MSNEAFLQKLLPTIDHVAMVIGITVLRLTKTINVGGQSMDTLGLQG